MKRIALCVGLLIICSACNKKLSPSYSTPSGIDAVRGSITNIVASNNPFIETMLKIEGHTPAGTYQTLLNFQVGDFAITENNSPVVIDALTTSRVALSAVLVLDRSGSMRGTSEIELEAGAKAFVGNLLGIDEVEIIDFSDTPTIAQTFTGDIDELKTKIDAGSSSGMTALWWAAGVGVEEMNKGGNSSKILIVMTDGGESGASYGSDYPSADAVIAYARSLSIQVNCVGLGGFIDTDLSRLSSETGGIYKETPDPSELPGIYLQFFPQVIDHVVLHYRTREKGNKIVDVFLNYGIFSKTFRSQYSS
jgi:hypothetical protein